MDKTELAKVRIVVCDVACVVYMVLMSKETSTALRNAIANVRQGLIGITNPDPRSITALDVAERYINGEATRDELYAAVIAAADAHAQLER